MLTPNESQNWSKSRCPNSSTIIVKTGAVQIKKWMETNAFLKSEKCKSTIRSSTMRFRKVSTRTRSSSNTHQKRNQIPSRNLRTINKQFIYSYSTKLGNKDRQSFLMEPKRAPTTIEQYSNIDHKIWNEKWRSAGGGVTPHHLRRITNQEDYLDYLLAAHIVYIYIKI